LGQLDLTEARSSKLLWPSQGETGTSIIMVSVPRTGWQSSKRKPTAAAA
jgi:hypothetical protein